MQINNHSATPKPSGPLQKIIAFIATAALVGLVLMFSVVMFAIILAVGAIAGVYLWWKTRELRKQMRDFQPRSMPPGGGLFDGEVFVGEVFEGEALKGEVIEGEAIRVIDSRDVN